MRRLLLLGFGLLACGGDDSNTTDGGPDASQTDGAPSDGGTMDVTDGGAGDGNTKIQQLDACTPVEGGLACDPAHVTCGATSCSVPSSFCCVAPAMAMMMMTPDASVFTCDVMAMQCQGNTVATCDQAANCPSGQVCCGFVGPGGGYATSCQPTCEGNAVQFCRGTEECAAGSCVVQTCSGVLVETCGGLTECPP